MKRTLLLIICCVCFLVCTNVSAHATYIYNHAFAGYFTINFERASRKGAPKLLVLARLCQDAGMVKYTRKCCHEIDYLSPGNKEVNTWLGKVKHGKKYVFPRDRDAAIQEENQGKQMWGETFVSPELFSQSQQNASKEQKLPFAPCYFKRKNFELFIDSDYKSSWQIVRLVESLFNAWDMEFSSGLGDVNDPIRIIAYFNHDSLKKHVADSTGIALKDKFLFDSTTNTLKTCYRDNADLIRSVIHAILSQRCTVSDCNYWAYCALQEYFVTCQESGDTITIGHVTAVPPTTEELDLNYPLFEKLFNLTKEQFNSERDRFLPIAWQFFYLANHEYQGVFKKSFHRNLKLALKGKCTLDSIKKIEKSNLIFCQIKNLVRFIPIGTN